jgi:hypothetical protein
MIYQRLTRVQRSCGGSSGALCHPKVDADDRYMLGCGSTHKLYAARRKASTLITAAQQRTRCTAKTVVSGQQLTVESLDSPVGDRPQVHRVFTVVRDEGLQ